ncbi:MAG: 2-hydroxyglutaryl-CoA dehydratase [Polyangiaceae bacterium]|nr:2-hydroxyglutaryl-CoA dehydratase [Polyangiaceae bacterium]
MTPTTPQLDRPDPAVSAHRRLPLAPEPTPGDDFDLDAELAAFEREERARLGVREPRRQWSDGMTQPRVRSDERARVTLLVAGLTQAQDHLVTGALAGLGYRVENIGMPDTAALRFGKEYGNRAQCNPTYFTVGNLVKYLCQLRDEAGLSAHDIVERYVFLTAGACGPCRFGMYVTEYRKALRDAGFDGFRVMLFQQQGGLAQATGEASGLVFDPPFFIAILKAIVAGDVLNAVGYRIRPYELEPGATARAMTAARDLCHRALADQGSILFALWQSRALFAAVAVDKLRVRPKVSIIGEFWAMTTEGDGNYHLQEFLEREGSENDIQLTTAWLLYNIWEVSRDTRLRLPLRSDDGGKYGLAGSAELDMGRRLALLRLAERLLRAAFGVFALLPGLSDYHLPDMKLIAELANPHYANDLRGGEGHMEVGKVIANVLHKKAHMTLSVKPFGCMPSSGVSDGVQSLVTAKYPGSIFCAVETSGDGAANFYSRVQMYLFKARLAAEQELERAFAETGVTKEQVLAFLARHPRYASALHRAPHRVAGSAANLVYEVAPLLTQSRRARLEARARRLARQVATTARALPGALGSLGARVRSPALRAAVLTDLELVRDLAVGKARSRFAPLVTRLVARAWPGADAAQDRGAPAAEAPLAAE